MNQVNYQKQLDSLLDTLGGTRPHLFLHSCCAPCSSYVLEYLCRYFFITVFYYNPNISAQAEYQKRAAEQRRLIEAYNREEKGLPIRLIDGDYDPAGFLEMARGLETCPEGGERCFGCYRLRLEETARQGAGQGADFFGTTLTISPLKNAVKINEIGGELAAKYGIRWLPSDFKKREGYKRSVELSREYGLYRQDYCGCVYSRMSRC